ncbi:MAG: trimethylamine methyltransferase family protein, partial [Promethearchaeota archaeon]
MKLRKIEVFSKDEIQEIHSASIQLLTDVGMKIDAQDTRNLLKENGAEVDNESGFVKFSESLIREKLKIVPDHFRLYGPNGKFNFEVNTKDTIFATIGTPVKIYDPMQKKGVRKTLFSDTIQQIKIVDSLENILCSHIDVWPNDISYITIHVHCIYQWAKNTKKPYGLGCLGKLASTDMMKMTSMIVGGD